MSTENKSQKNIGIALGVIVIIGVITVTMFTGKSSPDVSNTPQTPIDKTPTTPITQIPVDVPKTTPPINNPKTVSSIYKDGTYSATGSYMSPGGYDQLGVTLTLANDIITDVTATNEAKDGTSSRYQNRFISGYKTYVVGKNIADVKLTKVSGSSLTPGGFNDALAQIKTQAKA